nr:S8 family serine peptidase [Chloroflexaceae bacterium]
ADSTGGQTWYAGYVAAWRAAGIIPLFAAGNSRGGPAACGSIASPGDFANVVAVGATDNADQIASFSQRGPSADGRLKPDISAPGTAVPSTVAGGGLAYSTLNGTSMATPITSGVVALMLSANPDLIGDYDRVYSLLTGSARPRPSSICGGSNSATGVPNNVYGYGRVDAYAAVAAARVDVPWLATTAPAPIVGGGSGQVTVTLDARRIVGPGVYEARLLIYPDVLTLTPLVVPVRMQVSAGPDVATVRGTVRALDTDQPLLANVTIDEGVSLQSATDGSFSLVLPQRSQPYTITASTQGFLSQTQVVTVSTSLLEVHFTLGADAPRLSTSPEPPTITLRFSQAFTMPLRLENSGTRPLNFSLSVPNERFGVWRSDVSGGPAPGWIDPPASARVLTLGDDQASAALPLGFDFPFNGVNQRQVYVSANGFLSFGALPRVQSFRSSCLPLPETNEAAIVPLRMDLDPNVGGRITAAQLENGFLVTFDNVPRHGDATSRYSFQVLLASDGRVVLNYRQLGNLPPSAAMGLQFFGPDNQLLGCDGDLPLAPNLTVELRPQPNTRLWMSVPESGGSIEPGEATSVAVVFRWLHPNYQSPYSGTLLVTSNDPAQPTARLPMRLTLSAAPYSYLFPIILKDARPSPVPE